MNSTTTDIKTSAIRAAFDIMNDNWSDPVPNAWDGFDIAACDYSISVCDDDTDVVIHVLVGRGRLIDSTVRITGAAARSSAVIVATIMTLADAVTA